MQPLTLATTASAESVTSLDTSMTYHLAFTCQTFDIQFLCNTLKRNGDQVGCFINPFKTRILTSCNGNSPLETLLHTNRRLATEVINTITRFFSTEPHPTSPSDPSTPVELLYGFRLLGHPVGSPSFAHEFFTTCLATVESNVESIHSSIDDDQTKLRLFSQSSSRRFHTYFHLTFYIISPPTSTIHPGKNGMGPSPRQQTGSYNPSYHASSSIGNCRNVQSSSASSDSWTEDLTSSPHEHEQHQTLYSP